MFHLSIMAQTPHSIPTTVRLLGAIYCRVVIILSCQAMTKWRLVGAICRERIIMIISWPRYSFDLAESRIKNSLKFESMMPRKINLTCYFCFFPFSLFLICMPDLIWLDSPWNEGLDTGSKPNQYPQTLHISSQFFQDLHWHCNLWNQPYPSTLFSPHDPSHKVQQMVESPTPNNSSDRPVAVLQDPTGTHPFRIQYRCGGEGMDQKMSHRRATRCLAQWASDISERGGWRVGGTLCWFFHFEMIHYFRGPMGISIHRFLAFCQSLFLMIVLMIMIGR